MRPTCLILIFLLCLYKNASPQDTLPGAGKTDYYPNIASVSFGLGPIYGLAMANYERMILNFSGTRTYSLWLRGGIGFWEWWEETGIDCMATLCIVTGKKKSHFEGSLGVVYASWFASGSQTFLPAGTLGYRYQKPGGHLMFRAGAGWPEAAYVGVGYCF